MNDRAGELVLDKLKVACAYYVARAGFEGPAAQMTARAIDHERVMGESAGYLFASYLLGLGAAEETVEFRVPSDWWQHLKERWFPGWALRRWPTHLKTLTARVRTYKKVCPHLNVASQDAHFRFFYDDTPLEDYLKPFPRKVGERSRPDVDFCALCGAWQEGLKMYDTMGQRILATKCQGPWHHHNPPYDETLPQPEPPPAPRRPPTPPSVMGSERYW